MRRFISCSVLLLVLVLVGGGVATGAIINVPGDYPTIQAAINAAVPDDEIVIAAGYYEENDAPWRDLHIDKSLWLHGAGSGSTVVGLSAGKTNGVEIYGSALDVTIEGMTFTKRTGNPSASGFNIRIGEVASTFNTLVFRDVESAYATGRNVFIDGNGTYTSITVEDCSFHHSGAWGFSVRGVVTALNITNSDFEYNGTSDAAHGIGFDIDMPITVSGITVQGGSFSHNKAKGINLVKTTNATFTGITASSNAGAPDGGFGVSLWEWVSASSGITVEESTIENNSTDGILFGAEGTCTITGITVRGCRLTGNGRHGVLFYSYMGGTASNVAVNECYLDGNAGRGIANSALVSFIDGSANWWGVLTPGGVAAKAGTNLDYTPWLANDDDLSSDPGFQADRSVLWVDDDSPQTGSVGRVQEGVDLVSGSTVNVAAGLYDERVIVNKAVTLLGATNGVSKKGFAVPLGYAYDPLTQSIIKPSTDVGDVTVVEITADNVVFDGFVVANEVCATGGVYRDLITINQSLSAPTGIQILNNVLGPNTNKLSQDGTMSRSGICAPGPRTNPLKLVAKNNKIFDVKGNGCGIMLLGSMGPSGGGGQTNLYSGSVIENNEITGNHRSGIELAGGVQGGTTTVDYFEISNNLITNNGWFALADKDNLKYGHGIMIIRIGSDRINCDAFGARYIDFEGNVMTGNEKSGVYIGPMNKDLLWSNNTIANNGLGTGGYSLWDGVRVDLDESYYPSGTCTNYAYLTNIPFSNNSLSGNGVYGMQVMQQPTLGDVDASNNWWGDATGPQHPTNNPGGLGNDVSDYVIFQPWMAALNQISVVPASGLTKCGTPITYTFHIDRAGSDQARGYDVKFDVNDLIVTVADATLPLPMDIGEGTYLSSVGPTSFFVTVNGGGTYTVSCAILGGSVGATGSGDLFTVAFTPVAAGTSPITMVNLKLRDLNNQQLPVSGVGGSVQVDCTLPTMEAIAEAQGQCYKTAPVFSNFGFDDDVNLDLADYNFDGGTWISIFSGINAATWDSDGWVLPGFAGLSEGSHTVYFRVKDDAGNYNAGTYSWTFIKDTVAPAPPTNFVALPGHNKVHLTWTNPTGDASFAGVEIRVRGWGDYPEYGTGTPVVPAPSYPSGPTDGTQVVLTTGTQANYDDSPRAPRDIYYYTAFSKDCAGNYSTAVTGTMDRSTSYWLGDIVTINVGDGIINSGDVGRFAGTFGVVQGGGGWIAEADFGPTDDNSRFGIPLPDDVVDFEDLMILAMNHGNVGPLGTSGLDLLASSDRPLREQVSFKLVPVSREGDQATYSLVMENGAKVLKGFALSLSYGVGNELVEVKPASAFSGKATEHFFGTIAREVGKVEVCVAALGVDRPMAYTGEVARVVVREEGSNAVKLDKVVLRDVTNHGDDVVVENTETPFVPVVSGLMQNHPNPFNPVTTITYDVAVSGAVRIEIYDVSGHRVRTLVSGPKDAGRHVIEWNGRDENGSTVHTGVYFYRMTAPGYVSPARKMLLLK